MINHKTNCVKILLILVSLSVFSISLYSQIDETVEGYFFQKRLLGPKHRRSSVLEVMIDKYDNYLAVTFRAEKSTQTYLKIYELYSWEEKTTVVLDDRRVELYNSSFDPEGKYFYANTDIFKNKFKQIEVATGKSETVDCSATPNGCQKIEPLQYLTDGYTSESNYYIYRPDRFKNSVIILRRRGLLDDKGRTPGFLLDEEEAAKELEAEMNMVDPNQEPDEPESEPEPEITQETPKEEIPKPTTPEPIKKTTRPVPTSYIDFMLDKKQISDLDRYKYCLMANYEIIINNWLAQTFVFDSEKTKSITISEDEFKTLITTGSVTTDIIKINIPTDLIRQ